MSAVAGQAPEKKGNNVLVVDDFALSVINAAVSHNDLLKAGFMSACCPPGCWLMFSFFRDRQWRHDAGCS